MRKMATFGAGAMLIGVLIGGVGCATLFPTPTATPTSTPTPTATSTSTPTATSTPTVMPTATATATEIPTDTPTADGSTTPGGVPAACSEPGGCAIFEGQDRIEIIAAGPMTGDNSAFGIDAFQAAQLAVKLTEPVEGIPIEVVQANDLGTGAGGAAVAAKLSADPKIVAVMGHAFSGASSNAMPIYAQKYIPMMSGSATRVDLTEQGNPSFNRLVSTDVGQAVIDSEFLAQSLGAQKVAIIHDGTFYGAGLAEGVSARLKAKQVDVVTLVEINPGEVDYSDVVRKIKALGPDALFFSGYQPEAAVIVSNMQEAGMDIPMVAGDGVFGYQFLDLAKDDAEGVYVSQAGAPLGKARDEFDAAYEDAYGGPPGTLSGYTWFYYDATMVLIEAIRKVAILSGDGTLYIPRKALMDAVRHTEGYEGLTGTVTCDPTGECAKTPTFVFFQVQHGEYVQLPADYRP